MGTSVCLHSDELVSERPLERAWQSPMTHSLLYLQDDTLVPALAHAHSLPPTSSFGVGGAVAGCSLSPAPPPIHIAILRRLR